jgi:hypothetical protein
MTNRYVGLMVLFLATLLVAVPASAANICVGPTENGNGSGSDWNNVAQWSSVTLSRGNTYYLKEGTYGGKSLSTATSGSTPIIVKKCTAGEGTCTAITGWIDSMGDAEAVFTGAFSISSNYWEIDGTTGGGPGSWKAGHGFKWTSNAGTDISYIIISSDVSNVIVSRAKFEQVGNVDISISRGIGIYNSGNLLNSKFEYLYFDNLGGLPWLLRNGSGNIFQYNYSGHICGMSMVDPNQHCEAIVIHGMGDVHFRWNYISESPSSGGFIKNNTPTSTSVRIYGNIIGNGFPINCNSGPCTNWAIYNNTFFKTRGGPIGGDGGIAGKIYNFIIYDGVSARLGAEHDYNWYSKSSVSCSQQASAHENVTTRYPNNCDILTETSDPFVNSSGTNPEDWQLTSPIAGWPGTNVCVFDSCTGENKYNIDMLGRTRGEDGVWDRGAIEFNSGGVVSHLSAPVNLRIIQ